MKHEKIKCNLYLQRIKTEWNGRILYSYYFYKSRPVTKNPDKETLYRVKTGNKFTIYSNDFDEIMKGTTSASLCDFVFKTYLSTNIFENKEIISNRNGFHFKNSWSIPANGFEYECFTEDDLQLVTTQTKKDLEIQKAKENEEINKKLLKGFFHNNLSAVLNKYGMRLNDYDHGEISFKDENSFREFMFNALETTVIKDLKQLQLEAKPRRKTRKFNWRATMIDLKDIKVNLKDLGIDD